MTNKIPPLEVDFNELAKEMNKTYPAFAKCRFCTRYQVIDTTLGKCTFNNKLVVPNEKCADFKC